MAVTFPEVRVGDAVEYEGLSVFPLFAEPREDVAYVLSDEAIENGTVAVEEVSDGGSVPELTVENEGDHASTLVLDDTVVHASLVCASP